MTGYTRQSIAEIAIDEEVKAEPLNAEFNALADAFNSSSGHAHDGTSGSGPRISLSSSVTGNLPATNIANNSIPYAKLENIANNKVLGNVSGSTASISPVDILDEDNMVSNRSDALPTQQSVKAYVDALDGAVVDAIEVLTDAFDEELLNINGELLNINGELLNINEELSDIVDYINTVKSRFMANKNAVTQSWPSASTSIIVTFGTEVEDEGSIYDPATSRFTPQNGKRYFVYGQYRLNNTGNASDNSIECRLLKNGADVVAVGEGSRQTTFNTGTATVTFMVTGNGSDYYQIQASSQRSFTDTINGDVSRTYFMAYEI